MKSETLQHILTIGTDLIHKNGYGSVGLNKVLKTANVPKGSFYYYFDSKEDFGMQVIDFYAKQSHAFLTSFLENEALDSKSRILQLFHASNEIYHEQNYQQGCLLGNCSLELSGQSEPFADKIAGHFEIWQQLFAKTIEVGQKTGAIKNETPADELAHFILNSWEGALVRMKSTKNNKPMDVFIRFVKKML